MNERTACGLLSDQVIVSHFLKWENRTLFYWNLRISSLETVARIFKKIDQGLNVEDLRKWLDPDQGYGSGMLNFYIYFAIENDWIVKEEESGKYTDDNS